MRLLFVAPTLGGGGAERVLALQLSHFDRAQFAPQLAVFENVITYPVPADVPVHVLQDDPVPFVKPRLGLPRGSSSDLRDPRQYLRGRAAVLARHVRHTRSRAIIAGPLWASLVAALAKPAFPRGVRLVARVDSPPSEALVRGAFPDLLSHMVATCLPNADVIVAVCDEIAGDLVDNFGIDPKRVRVVHNPTDVQAVLRLSRPAASLSTPEPPHPYILFVGRLERVKNVDVLLRAFAAISPSLPLHCVLVGDGSESEPLRTLAASLGIAERVHFEGWQDNPYRYMARAAALVLPSSSEGMPNVLIEAMAAGCPVIATDVALGACRRLVGSGERGILVPPNEVEPLAHAIEGLMTDRGLRERLIANGRAYAQQFDLPLHIEQSQRLIVDLH